MHEESEVERTIELEITDILDLHSFSPKEVAAVVESYLEAAIEAGFRYVRIIHGRGIGAQRRTVRRVLERHAEVLEYSDAPSEAGGWGATSVTLKAGTSSSN